MVVITAIVVALAFAASTPPSPPPSPAPTSSTPTTEVPVGSTPAEVDYVEADTDLAPGRLYVHLDEVTPAQQEAIDVAFAAQLLAEEAYVNPELEGLTSLVPELYHPGGQQWNEFENGIVVLRDGGYRFEFSSTRPWEFHVFSVEIEDVPYRHAQIYTCLLDTSVLLETGGAPDGGDAVVDDIPTAQFGWLTLTRHEGSWKSYWLEPDGQRLEGSNASCELTAD